MVTLTFNNNIIENLYANLEDHWIIYMKIRGRVTLFFIMTEVGNLDIYLEGYFTLVLQ
jgi:hypothetical protein